MGWTPGEDDDWRKDYSRSHRRAKKLRAEETPSEKKLWKILRTLKHEGAHFRRQCQVGNFVYDFACLAHHLLIELDGGVHEHADVQRRDREKAADAERRGYRVLRLQNAEVDYAEHVIGRVRSILTAPHP